MRLLKTGPFPPGQEKLEIIERWGRDIPPYAILSHTWANDADDEVLFCDVRNGTCKEKPAFSKLTSALRRAVLDGYGYLWIDTCCIDKTSSMELSEAINSMYSYYQKAEKCYAFLADVSSLEADFKDSRWWRRGWTLQELLAPGRVEFFSAEWRQLGNKVQLSSLVSTITGIDSEYLTGARRVQHASIAARMFWAAERHTTREEDLAYCLMGLFDVNMSMLYGEGATRSFVRLQEEIMKGSEDQSIFAWIKPDSPEDDHCGLLAESPKHFKYTGSTVPYSEIGEYIPFSMTARGLHVTLPLTRKKDGTYFAALQCPLPGKGYNDWLAIYLKRFPNSSNVYARFKCATLASCSELGKLEPFYVRQNQQLVTKTLFPYHFFQIRHLSCITSNNDLKDYRMIADVYPPDASSLASHPKAARQPWSDVSMAYKINKVAVALTAAILVQRESDGERFVLLLGSLSAGEVGFDVLQADNLGTVEEMQREFAPKVMNSRLELQYHKVRVKSEEKVHNDQKTFLINIEIEPIPKPKEMLEKVIETMANPSSYCQDDGLRAKLSRFRNKLLRIVSGFKRDLIVRATMVGRG